MGPKSISSRKTLSRALDGLNDKRIRFNERVDKMKTEYRVLFFVLGTLASFIALGAIFISLFTYHFVINIDPSQLSIEQNKLQNISIELKGFYPGVVNLETSKFPYNGKITLESKSVFLIGPPSYLWPKKVRGTIYVGDRVAPGSHKIKIIGNGGGYETEAILELIVKSKKTFIISLNKDDIVTDPSQESELMLNITGEGGYEGLINLYAKEPRSDGIKVVFEPPNAKISKDRSSSKCKVKIWVDPNAQIKPYKIELVGEDTKNITAKAFLSINVKNPKKCFILNSAYSDGPLNIERGKKSSFIISGEGKNGYHGIVSLSYTDLNKTNKIDIDFDKDLLDIYERNSESSLTSDSNATVSVDSNLTPGDYYIRIIGNDQTKCIDRQILKIRVR